MHPSAQNLLGRTSRSLLFIGGMDTPSNIQITRFAPVVRFCFSINSFVLNVVLVYIVASPIWLYSSSSSVSALLNNYWPGNPLCLLRHYHHLMHCLVQIKLFNRLNCGEIQRVAVLRKPIQYSCLSLIPLYIVTRTRW